jgi:hypothetical protein
MKQKQTRYELSKKLTDLLRRQSNILLFRRVHCTSKKFTNYSEDSVEVQKSLIH